MQAILVLVTMCALIAAMLSGAMIVAWRAFGHPPHALTWAAAFGAAGLQWAINIILVAFHLPGRPPGSPIGFLLAAMPALMLYGVRQRAGYRGRGRLIAAGWAIATLIAPLGLAGMAGHRGLATLIPKLFTAACLFAAACYTVPPGRPSSSGERGMRLLLVAYGSIEAALGLAGLAFGVRPSVTQLELYHLISAFGVPGAFSGIGLFAVFLIASDLSVRMQRLASTDPLTGLLNRRGLDEALAQIDRRALSPPVAGCVVLIDLDSFKTLNDRHGHAAGDLALRGFAAIARDDLRRGDLIARIGGEEFALLLPHCDTRRAIAQAEQLRAATAALILPEVEGMRVTASFGVAALRTGRRRLAERFGEALARADTALMHAKDGGRNRVMCADTAPAAAHDAAMVLG